ncbi:helix-turn-helix domain-containing protein [Microbacterium sp. No. 7]|uniref:helix-turn-helix domain-containing protein n=1 Tax=Microbacterium sp. No. 7 TaxID=1714373 RepID=UPI0012E0D2F7|nr:helix-turn-helix domain-containing protein [Microbacterium sp. No. 7]
MPLKAGADTVQLLALRAGTLRLPRTGEVCVAGGLLLHPGAVPVPVEAVEVSDFVSLTMPAVVLEHVGDLPPGTVFVVPESKRLARGVVAFLLALVEGSEAEMSSIARYSLEQLLQEMMIALVLDGQRARHASRRRNLFDEAQAIVLARSSDVTLGAAVIAAECNVSPRTLERAYAARDTTVRAEIRRARLAHAVSLLQDAAYDALTVDQIAQYVGFSNGSSLARAMRAEALAAPTVLRQAR